MMRSWILARHLCDSYEVMKSRAAELCEQVQTAVLIGHMPRVAGNVEFVVLCFFPHGCFAAVNTTKPNGSSVDWCACR